ncbi:hypothetical protein J2129_000356 [Methanofollis sp. W23]|uniref:hypothetical protein n=1 Tax=Methanofollis sp. W23 TaxID=2817849 RepID=UPI001AE54931|nr:hypothetical protein [Methanofollis sp. W23]MBP2144902.1 hypothetical protein [Methanofollis sp. W23]
MKLDPRDYSLLSSLHPLDIAEYLSSRGWKNLEVNPEKFSTWEYVDEENNDRNIFDILLPLNQEFKDYEIRIGEIINILENVEKRPQIEILKDLQMIFADVVRVRRDTPETSQGNVPINMGVQLVQQAKEMVLAAACSTIEPRPFFPPKKFKDALEYMETVFMGQTEIGSYILPIISKLPPPYRGQQYLFEPFERQVTQNLACALNVMNTTAQEYIEKTSPDDSIEIFKSTVQKGVSANLCEAVVEMSSFNDDFQDVEFGFTWSPKYQTDQDIPKKIVLKAEKMPIFEKAADYLREFEPKENFVVYGPVLRLERLEESTMGKITVQSFVFGSVRNIKIELSEHDYHLAIQAHDQQKNVYCKGTLQKEGRTYWLSVVHHFDVES